MSDHDDINQIVEIDFEVGHSSTIRSEPTTNHYPPRTHDWKVFLRSADVHGDLSCLIHHCIFHLHPEFTNHKRELKTTPFAIQETGYAGFHLPIEIYFKTKTEPRKFRIEYDLDLHNNIAGHPYRQKESFLKKYRCTFYDPDPDFRQKILAAGGKIVDSGPISSNNTDLDESDKEEEIVVRHSPQQKRPASPVSLASGILHKKVKLEQSTNNAKKKQVQSVVKNENENKTSVNNKKTKLVPHKSSSILDEKVSKNLSNQTINMNSNIESKTNSLDPLSSKPRTSKKLIKSQSTNDIKSSIPSTLTNNKKKEAVPSPSKTKSITHSQTILKKPIHKIPFKTSIKPESISTSTIKLSSDTIIKQESSPPLVSTIIPSNTTTPSVSINNLKKIPKKTTMIKVEEKRSRSLMPSLSLNRTSSSISKTTQKQSTVPLKTKSNLKRDHSSSSAKISSNSNERSRKTKIVKDQSKPLKPTHSPRQSDIDPPMNSIISAPPIDTSQPSIPTPPPTHILPNEDNHIRTPMDIDTQNNDDQIQLSVESYSPREPIPILLPKILSNQISYLDQSDTIDTDMSTDDEQDLPTSLTNDDLRYKLIYIYKRFQLNSIDDLTVFVRFFKRHQLINISSLSMTKSTNEMFTYDLFSLSPSHIGELANDLGYSTMNMIDSID